MKLKEFLDKDLLVDKNGIVFNKNETIYKDSNGFKHFLDVSDSVKEEIIRIQIEEGDGKNLNLNEDNQYITTWKMTWKT